MINLADILKIDCDFIKGSLKPSNNKNFTPTEYHGKNGLCGLILSDAKKEVFSEDFLKNLYDIIKERKNITYIAVGPLTNFAKLLERFPDCADYIGELIIMGGGFDVSNMAHNAEFNFSADPAAVKKVLACPVKKTLAPLDITHQLSFSLTDIEDITGIKQELLSGNMSEAFAVMAKLLYLNYETSVKNENDGALIHDATTLLYLLDKNKCDVNQYNITSDEYGAVSKNSSGYSVNVIDKIDRDFVKNLFKRSFYEYK